MARSRHPAKEIECRLSEEEQDERIEQVRDVFALKPVEDAPLVWKLTIHLRSGREVTVELTDREAGALAQELGIRSPGVGASGKGSFVFEKLKRE